MVVLDTHTVVWWAGEPKRLGSEAADRLSREDELGIPTIVFWETALLVRKQRLDLGMTVKDWMHAICSIPRVRVLPLTAEIALRADELEMHDDPADRFIVATSLLHNAVLVTKDRPLRALRFIQTAW